MGFMHLQIHVFVSIIVKISNAPCNVKRNRFLVPLIGDSGRIMPKSLQPLFLPGPPYICQFSYKSVSFPEAPKSYMKKRLPNIRVVFRR